MKNRRDSAEGKNWVVVCELKNIPRKPSLPVEREGALCSPATPDHLVSPAGTGGAQPMRALAVSEALLSGLKFQITRDCSNGVLSVDDTV